MIHKCQKKRPTAFLMLPEAGTAQLACTKQQALLRNYHHVQAE